MKTLAIIGLGYVGLPLAIEFGKIYRTFGFDSKQERINELLEGYDCTQEVPKEEFAKAEHLILTSNLSLLSQAQIYIISVPTPIHASNQPDLTHLKEASKAVGGLLKKGDIVIYESTVYPGCTQEECVPILEHASGLFLNQDFFVGYSPERINPGDKDHRLIHIKKITSGSTPQVAQEIDELYASIIKAGTHKAPSIKVAEAAKVIENAQRDINIAFVNELALIFEKMQIDTFEVLEAAGTKWNFLPFRPGLVGGHCIGVDPYYLTYKAQILGYQPQVILAGRRINDTMPVMVANKIIKLMIKQGLTPNKSKIAMLGITFKENCPDIRNSKVIEMVRELQDFSCCVEIFDPFANAKELLEYDLALFSLEDFDACHYEVIVLAVAHDVFKNLKFSPKALVFDCKGILPKEQVSARL